MNESCFTELMGNISMQSTARDLTGAFVERMVGAVGKFQIMNYIMVDSVDEARGLLRKNSPSEPSMNN